jgi:hypothetical protein
MIKYNEYSRGSCSEQFGIHDTEVKVLRLRYSPALLLFFLLPNGSDKQPYSHVCGVLLLEE